MSKVSVKFVKSWRGYGKGEVAGFDEATAQALVDGGVATSNKVKASSKPAAKASASTSSTAASGGSAGAADTGGSDNGGDDNEKP